MNTPDIPDSNPKNSKSLISGKELAQILDVSASTLSEAVKNGHNCGGYPVLEWAEFNRFGRVEGYDVPNFLFINHKSDKEPRTNPDTEQPEKAENEAVQQESVVNNNYSLLPAGENFTNPVGMASLSMVLKHALGNDTPQTRAVIGGTLALLGAITAHSITDSGMAAGLGAGAGLGIAIYFYTNANNQNMNPSDNNSMPIEASTRQQLPMNKKIIRSGYLV